MAAKVARLDISSLISVIDFKRKLIQSLGVREIVREKYNSSRDELAEEMGVPVETVDELSEVCSPTNLECPAEPKDLDLVDINKKIPDNVDLMTLSILRDRKGQITNYRKEINYLIKEVNTEKPTQAQFMAIQDPEIVLSVAIYHPKVLNKVQEFLVLGQQNLTKLRDKIYCNTDHIVPGDHSENPDLSLQATARDICKSGFFFIEEVFYNDTRDQLCRDYSRSIREWADTNGLGDFTSEKMEDTKFEELRIKLGYPYIYCHQGNCEHLVIFTDLRLLDADDAPNVFEYPVQTFRHRGKRRRCKVCEIYTARWITKNDILASEDPSFFCNNCFKQLHYSPEGEKLCDFEAYPHLGYSNW